MNCNNILSVDKLKHKVEMNSQKDNKKKLLYERLEFMKLSYLYKEMQVCSGKSCILSFTCHKAMKIKLKFNGKSQKLWLTSEAVYEIYNRVC